MKNQERISKKACERYQNLSEEEKEKSTNIFVGDIDIFLKKKKKRSVNRVVKNFLEDEKVRLLHKMKIF